MYRNLLKIYYALPFFIQNLIFNYKAKKDFEVRYSGNFQKYYTLLLDLWKGELSMIEQYQKTRVTALLTEAFNYSDWFRKIFDQLGLSITDTQNDPFGALFKLPFLEKADLRQSLELIVSKNPKMKSGEENYTSGTTGSPMKTYNSLDSIAMSFAIWKRFHVTIGLPFFHKSVRFSGNQIVSLSQKKPPFWLYNKYENRYFFSLYHLTQINLTAYIEKLNEVKPELLDGYPSGVYALANYILNNNIPLHFSPKAICTTAEPLTPLIRETIETAFQCKVYNQYSSSEGGVFITECLKGKLHVNLDSGYVEYFNEKNEVGKPGEICQIILTGFRNFKTPLIRYRTGDWVQLAEADEKCTCGTHMPVIQEIYGRIEDYLLDENGIEQGMVSYRAFKLARNIIKAQIIQEPDNHVTVKIVKDKNFQPNDEAFILGRLQSILGKSIPFSFTYCNDIDGGANGKFKTVIRKKT